MRLSQALRSPLHLAVLAAAFLFFASQAWLFQHTLDSAPHPVLIDFNDYHVVGRMVATGKAEHTYDWPALRAEQIAQTRSWAFMPWAYPPQFTLFTAILGLLPIAAAYMLFIGSSWMLFYTALLRLAGRATVPALVVALPAILINAKCGQSGFLSAGLIGWFLVAIRERSTKGGWALGAMIFKPHLAAGIGLLCLLERKWAAIARATVLVVGLGILATIAMGPGIWAAYREGTGFASAYLWAGEYPLERMISPFAALHRFGISPAAAMAIHVIFGAASAVVLLRAWRNKVAMDGLLAIAVCVSLAISPYTYDYDAVAIALVAALILPRFVARASVVEMPLAILLSWIATANYLWIGLRQIRYGVPTITADMGLWTISPIALGLLGALVVVVLRRPAKEVPPWSRVYSFMAGKVPA